MVLPCDPYMQASIVLSGDAHKVSALRPEPPCAFRATAAHGMWDGTCASSLLQFVAVAGFCAAPRQTLQLPAAPQVLFALDSKALHPELAWAFRRSALRPARIPHTCRFFWLFTMTWQRKNLNYLRFHRFEIVMKYEISKFGTRVEGGWIDKGCHELAGTPAQQLQITVVNFLQGAQMCAVPSKTGRKMSHTPGKHNVNKQRSNVRYAACR